MAPTQHPRSEDDIDDSATETSPLLRKGTKKPLEQIPVEATADVTISSTSEQQAHAIQAAKATTNDVETQAQNAAADTDQQGDDTDCAAQFEGLPEVRKRMHIILPALAMGIICVAADQTVIASIYGNIGSDLNSLNDTSWLATSYFLTLASSQPLYGKLSDIFSRKYSLLFAYFVFGLGNLLCGLSQTMPQLIAARVFTGIGGGGMSSVVSILISDIIPLRERGQWQGYINLVYALGAGSGAPIGGLVSDVISWRWVFIVQAPATAIAFAVVALVLHLPVKEEENWKAKFKRIDFPGAVFLIAAISTLLIGLDRGSNTAWRDSVTIGMLAASVPLFVVFLFIENNFATEPFAPSHIIFGRSMFAAYLCNFFSLGGWVAMSFYYSLFMQSVQGFSGGKAGLRLMVLAIFGVSGSLSAGFYMRKTGKYYHATIACYSALVVGALIVLGFSGLIAYHALAVLLGACLASYGNTFGLTTTLIALVANASRADQAVATACSYLFRSLGNACGVALSASVTNQLLRSKLADTLRGDDAAELAEKVRGSLKFIETLEPDLQKVVRECYAFAIRGAFMLQIAFMACAVVSALWIRETKLSR